MGKETVIQVQEIQSPTQDKPKEEHILIKLTKIKDKEKKIKSNNGKATNNIQRNPPKVISWFFSRNSAGHKGVAQCI